MDNYNKQWQQKKLFGGTVLNENKFECNVNNVFEYNYTGILCDSGDDNIFDNVLPGMFTLDFFKFCFDCAALLFVVFGVYFYVQRVLIDTNNDCSHGIFSCVY